MGQVVQAETVSVLVAVMVEQGSQVILQELQSIMVVEVVAVHLQILVLTIFQQVGQAAVEMEGIIILH